MRIFKIGIATAAIVLTVSLPALADDAPGVNLASGIQLAQAPPPPMDMGLPAPAIDWTGFYIGGFLGGASQPTVKAADPRSTGGAFPAGAFYNAPFANATNGGIYHYGLGGSWFGGGTVGYNWQLPETRWVFGLEGEGGYLQHNGTAFDPYSLGALGGDSSDSTKLGPWYGLIGGRVGWAIGNALVYAKGGVGFTNYQTTFNDSCASGTCGGGLLHASASKTDVFGAGGAGVEYAINPAWSVKAEYLYMALDESATICGVGGGTAAGSSYCSSRSSGGSHTVKLGINYHFNAPPPPPPAPAAMPAPPPAAAKVFIVFFDWDKDVVTPEGQAIIRQAADAYRSGAPVQLQVTGYTDRSGSPGYNQRLSERRANNVARALAALGVPKNQMVVTGRGENDNRVPTAPGVREPQNRRVEIVAP